MYSDYNTVRTQTQRALRSMSLSALTANVVEEIIDATIYVAVSQQWDGTLFYMEDADGNWIETYDFALAVDTLAGVLQ